MNFFLFSLKMELISFFKERRAIALLLIFPLLAALLSFAIPENEMNAVVPVGIAIPEGSEKGEALFKLLPQENGYVEFILSDEDSLRKNVAAGKWECGFILRADFDKRLSNLAYSKLFTVVKNEGSTLDAFVAEAISSALLTLVSPDIGTEYLRDVGAQIPEDGWVLDTEFRISVIPAVDGELGVAGVSSGSAATIIRGFAAILLTVLAIAYGDRLAARRQTAYFSRVRAQRGTAAIIVPALVFELLLLFFVSLVTLLILGERGVLALFAFTLCLVSLSALISSLPQGITAAILPFLPPVLLILCPIFFDAVSIFPALRYLSEIIPVTQYLNAAGGNTTAFIGLALIFTINSALTMGLLSKSRLS